MQISMSEQLLLKLDAALCSDVLSLAPVSIAAGSSGLADSGLCCQLHYRLEEDNLSLGVGCSASQLPAELISARQIAVILLAAR